MVLLNMEIMYLFLVVPVDRKFSGLLAVTNSDLVKFFTSGEKIVNNVTKCYQPELTFFRIKLYLDQRKSGHWTMQILVAKNLDQILTTMHFILRYLSFHQISVLQTNKTKNTILSTGYAR